MNVKSEKLNNFHIYQPGTCHNLRFMAYAIYFLMLDMTSTVVEYLTPEKKHMVARVAFIVAIYYGPAILIEDPSAVIVTSDSRLEDLITKESWLFFILTGYTESVREWHTSSDYLALDSYKHFTQLVRNISVTNDCVERNISLIENFVHTSHNEDQRQNILLVVREHRKLITKDMSLNETGKHET